MPRTARTPSPAFKAAEDALAALAGDPRAEINERVYAERALKTLRTALEPGHTYAEAERLGILID